MDIAKFNKDLSSKITIAKSLEKSNEIPAAIKVWVEISEMTLRFSKSRNLDFSFKNMLIRKTEGIVQHIKNLKSGKIIEDISVEEIEEIEDIPDQEEVISSEELKPKESFSEEFLTYDEKENNAIESENVKFVEDSEFKNIPKGFKEIHPKKDFTIITPHNDDYVQKILKKDIDLSIFKPKKEENVQIQSHIELEQPKDGTKVICLACGAELPVKTKICPACGSTITEK